MTCKPNAKPLVLGWLNPLANGRLTIKQNKTKQDKAGFGSLNQNQNPPYLLVSQLYKQGFFSCFFSLLSCFVRLIRTAAERFYTGFQQSFPQSGELGGESMIAPTTRDGARELFASKLSYEQITWNDIRALEGFLAIEYARHERDGHHMEMRPSYRKKYQPEINLAHERQGIKSAFLRVSGFYFQGREAISFNEDGFIGIAGWADDTNVQPFLRAFYRWVCEWMIGVVYR